MVRASGQWAQKGSEIIYNWRDRGSTNSVLFFVAYSTSIITSSLGLAKNLKVGPCRILPEQKKHLGGLLSPRFVVLFFSCWHKGILKTFLTHPSVFLLPVFSHFTFASNSKFCCQGEVGEKSFISFSPKCTAINIGVSAAGIVAYVFTLPLTANDPDLLYTSGIYIIFGGLPCFILGLILTLLAAFSNRCNCCK